MSCLVTFLSQTNPKLRSLNQRFFTIALGLHINFRRKSYLIKKNRRTKIQLLGLPHWHFLTNCLKRYYLPIFKVKGFHRETVYGKLKNSGQTSWRSLSVHVTLADPFWQYGYFQV